MTLADVDLIETSSVTVRGYRHRTTVPSKSFKKLGLKDKDTLRWTWFKNGTLTLSNTRKSNENQSINRP